MSDRFFFLLAVVAYGLSAVHSVLLWRKGFRRDDFVNYLLVLLGFVGHTIAVFQRGYLYNQCPVYNIYEATTFFTWFSVLAYLVIGLWPRFRFLGAFAAPLLFAVGVFALMPWLDPPHGPRPEYSGGLRSLHAAVTLLAYASFGLSCAAALMLVTQEANLKRHRLNALLSLLPPMARLEIAVRRLLFAGWLLLTLGLGSGFLYLIQNRAEYPAGPDVKVIWSVLVWAGYGLLLLVHRRGWVRGRRLAVAAITAFLFVLLTFWGTNLLSPLHNPPLPPAQS
jgi:ABC-type uncharacterized transport system permease subunit